MVEDRFWRRNERGQIVAEDREPFLRVTFGGGRFATHVIPVDVLAELATLQQVILEIARQEFRQRNPGRVRVPRGFAKAARLDLCATEANCFTATLTREVPPVLQGIDPSMVDDVVAGRNKFFLLISPNGDGPPVGGFDQKTLKVLSRVGDRLGDGEWIDMQTSSDSARARIDRESRSRLSKMLRLPLEQVVDLEGEAVELDDHNHQFTLRTRERKSFIVQFEPSQRGDVFDAVNRRPALRVQLRGRAQGARIAAPLEEFDVIEHERKADIEQLWNRLNSFSTIPNGWLNGEGMAPSPEAIALARDVLARLISDHDTVPRPHVYPTPDGCVQAEWIVGRYSVDLRFSSQGDIVDGSAVHADRDEECDQAFTAAEVSRSDAGTLAEWLLGVWAEK